MTSTPVRLTRTNIILKPDQTRVLLRPFRPGDDQKCGRIIARILALPEKQVEALLAELSAEFSTRHQKIRETLLERFEKVREHHVAQDRISQARQMLIGSN